MATSGMSVGPKQAESVAIVGVPLSQEEVEGTVQALRFYYRAVKPSIIERRRKFCWIESLQPPGSTGTHGAENMVRNSTGVAGEKCRGRATQHLA